MRSEKDATETGIMPALEAECEACSGEGYCPYRCEVCGGSGQELTAFGSAVLQLVMKRLHINAA
jgi:hypothetical protein